MQRAFLAATHTHTEEPQSRGFHFFRPPLGILEMGIATVNHDVLGLQQGPEIPQHCVRCISCRHHRQDAARPLERRHKFLRRTRHNEVFAFHPLLGLPGFLRIQFRSGD